MATHSSTVAWKIPGKSLENPCCLDRGAWQATIHGVAKSQTQLSDFTHFTSGSAVKNLPAMQETQVQFPDRENPLEKEMATHSSILAWKIPWAEEPGRPYSMGLQESDTT